jgi:hypothetical protein
MQALVIITFCVAMLMDFATTNPLVPGVLKFTPELLSLIITVLILFRSLRGGLSTISAKYWFTFGFLSFVIVCGIFTNGVGPGPMLAGMRYDLRAIPLFLLPAVAHFTDEQKRTQFKVILGLALLQLPVSIYQRWTIYSQGRFSGDDVRGTVLDSGIMSMLLICVVCVLMGFFMRGQLKKWPFFILFFLLLFPTTINETKATVILLPVGLMATIIAASPPGKKLKVFFAGTALLGMFAAILFPIYALMNANSPYKDDKSLLDFFTNEKQLGNYVNDKKDIGVGGAKRMVGRGTAIKLPLKYLARDPVNLAFGLGLGNASHSNLGEQFSGRYYDIFKYFVVSSAAAFLLEVGVVGITLIFILYWLIFTDALAVAKLDKEGPVGGLAAGWIGVVGVMGLATFYNVSHSFVSVSYLYWYFAGMVVARRGELLALARQAPVAGKVVLRRAAIARSSLQPSGQ